MVAVSDGLLPTTMPLPPKAMMLPLPGRTPPIVFEAAPFSRNTPARVLPRLTVARASVPMRLPKTTFPIVPLSERVMPSSLPATTLAPPGEASPTVLLAAPESMSTPLLKCPSFAVPLMLVPMKLPATTFRLVPPPPMATPAVALPGTSGCWPAVKVGLTRT